MGTLESKQFLFSRKYLLLLDWLFNHGYDVTLGEAWRSDATAELDAEQGKGISHSLHRLRLAVDLNLFHNGIFLTQMNDYLPAGLYWEGLSDSENLFCWGGRFGDSDHFSLSYNGIK